MLIYPKPSRWNKAWSLHRRKVGQDSYGDPIAQYDMDNPDYSAEADSEGAVSWQAGTDGADIVEAGESAMGTASGHIFDPNLGIEPFDRVVFDNAVWEVTSVSYWPEFRSVSVRKVEQSWA